MKLYSLYHYFPEISHRILHNLQLEYSRPGRYYHNDNKILNMLSYYTQVVLKNSSDVSPLIMYSILYYDIVFDPLRDDNKEKSTEKFVKDLGNLFPDLLIDRVTQVILSTKDHVCKSSDEESKLVCDLDLMDLASSDYWYNLKSIRNENMMFSDEEFYAKRSKYLKSYLSRSYIFQTLGFRYKFENNARRLMKEELSHIKLGRLFSIEI